MGKYMRMLVVWIGGISICLAGCTSIFYLPEDVASICLSDGKALAAAEDFCQSRQAALADLLDRQPLTVTVASYADEDVVPALSSPNMLQAILRNRSGETICNVLVAFVAWDEDNRPVKIKEYHEKRAGTYVKEINYANIDLHYGDCYGEGFAIPLAGDHPIALCKAIVVSYETCAGETWTNPYYQAFRRLYAGKTLPPFS